MVAATDVAAKKKRKEIPTQICKRGKLIFEDDFSKKEMNWTFDESTCSWKVQKGALVTNSVKQARISRKFNPIRNFVWEARFVLPPKSVLYMIWGGMQKLQVFPSLNSSLSQAALRQWKDEGNADIAVTPFPYKKKRTVVLLFEVLDGQFALTVDTKCVKFNSEIQTVNESGYIRLELRQAQPNVLAIDYVKLWEALPKDESKKKHKRK